MVNQMPPISELFTPEKVHPLSAAPLHRQRVVRSIA